MADIKKTAGEPIDDEELGGVVGGVAGLSEEELEHIRNALKSGEFEIKLYPNTIKTRILTSPTCSPGTIEPLDNEATKRAEEFRQGINLGGLPTNMK